jgi:hypothetical protein
MPGIAVDGRKRSRPNHPQQGLGSRFRIEVRAWGIFGQAIRHEARQTGRILRFGHAFSPVLI